MHTIEPYYKWRDSYIASEDRHSPFFGREYSEFTFSNKIYNYFIHPQWDDFGSSTLYAKILFVEYDEKYAIIELIGEWNDCINNDIMFLKREVIDPLQKQDIVNFVICCDNVLNFHASDDAYYEEWYEEISSEGGWICLLNLLDHVQDEMESVILQMYMHFGTYYNNYPWQGKTPKLVMADMRNIIENETKILPY